MLGVIEHAATATSNMGRRRFHFHCVCVCIPEPNTPYMAVAMANGAIGGLDALHNAGHTHSLKLT